MRPPSCSALCILTLCVLLTVYMLRSVQAVGVCRRLARQTSAPALPLSRSLFCVPRPSWYSPRTSSRGLAGKFRVRSPQYASAAHTAHTQPSDRLTAHLSAADSRFPHYWIERLHLLDKPAARALIPQLIPGNPLGFDPLANTKGSGSGVSDSRGLARQGTLLDYTIQQKKKHPDKIILIRSGEFYETYGVDALMLINYAGLNPMGNKCKAGCPVRNVQATLDSLTAAGLSIAVFEEIAEIVPSQRARHAPPSAAVSLSVSGSDRDKESKVKIKSRALTQIVSPAASTYIYDLCLRPDDIDFRENHPAVGIARTAQGWLLAQVYLDERSVVVHERLTDEAVRALLSCSGAIDPLFLQDCALSDLPFLAHSHSLHSVQRISGYNERDFPMQVLQKLSRLLEFSAEDVEQFRIVNPQELDYYPTAAEDTTNTTGSTVDGGDPCVGDDQQPQPQPQQRRNRPRPVYTSTALQIGLLPNDNVPDLVPQLLPRTHNHLAVSARFLRKWLQFPPPHRIASEMQRLCRVLSHSPQSLPAFSAISVGKVVSLLHAKQCNVAVFRDIERNADSLASLLSLVTVVNFDYRNDDFDETDTHCAIAVEHDNDDNVDKQHSPHEMEGASDYDEIVSAVLAITSFECGLPATRERLLRSCRRVARAIHRVVAAEDEEDLVSSDPGGRVCDEFFRRNEEEFRNKVSLEHPQLREVYQDIDAKAKQLCAVVAREVPLGMEIVHDMMENSLSMREKPLSAATTVAFPTVEDEVGAEISSPTTTKRRRGGSTASKQMPAVAIDGVEYIAHLDRKGKAVGRRCTTRNLQQATAAYLQATSEAPLRVSQILQTLSTSLLQDLVPIVQSVYFAVILQTALAHCIAAKQKGWVLPTLLDFASSTTPRPSLAVQDLIPYWFAKDFAKSNSLDLDGLFLLTAPNMSGKSTLMRSLLVAALLANCGMFVPAAAAQVPRFDTFFLRTASYDIPSEAKSAFALEMDDMRVIMRDCTDRSLVMIDELGKGTSAKDGAALAGALLEYLDKKCVYGVFATHLHELFLLPLDLKHVIDKKMGFTIRPDDSKFWLRAMPALQHCS
jgi:hypothetical protein